MLKWGVLLLRNISTSRVNKTRARYSLLKVVFGKYLFWTNTLSSGVLMLVGDLIEQELSHDYKEKKSERYDYNRLGRMFLTGLSMGPVHHYYYKYLNILWPARDMKSITKKILGDQFFMGPLCIVQFFYTLGFLEKKTMKEMNNEVGHKFVSVYTVDWIVWPPSQFINFYLVPVRYQVFYINSLTTLYNVFLSYMKFEINLVESS